MAIWLGFEGKTVTYDEVLKMTKVGPNRDKDYASEDGQEQIKLTYGTLFFKRHGIELHDAFW